MVRQQVQSGFGWPSSVRMIAILTACVGAMWLVLPVTIAGIFADERPAFALRFAGWNAAAQAHAASDALKAGIKGSDLRNARDLAENAIRREPGNVVALRTLGFVYDIEENRPAALRMLQYAESLSRRDLATQLWFIEHAVEKADVGEALLHYDRALRTSASAFNVLFPILIRASADPIVARQLSDLLAKDPPWSRMFVSRLIDEGAADAPMVTVANAALDPIEDREIIVRLINRLVEEGQYDLGWAVYRDMRVPSRSRAPPLVRDGGFDETSWLSQFEWSLTEESDLSAIRQAKDSEPGDPALHLMAANGRGGDVARQLLMLPPGTYRLSALFGNTDGRASGPTLSIGCASGEGESLTRVIAPSAGEVARAANGMITISKSNCPAQWLVVSLRDDGDTDEATPWIDAIKITPI